MIVNALVAGRDMTGIDGHVVYVGSEWHAWLKKTTVRVVTAG